MTNNKRLLISLQPVEFKTRFIKSLISPWAFVWIGLLAYFSFRISFTWILTLAFIATYILMNYKATTKFLSKVELKKNCIEFTYYNSKMEKKVTDIPISELTVKYYITSKGISSLVSNHMSIAQKGLTIIKQYKTEDWTLENLKETSEILNEIKTNTYRA